MTEINNTQNLRNNGLDSNIGEVAGIEVVRKKKNFSIDVIWKILTYMFGGAFLIGGFAAFFLGFNSDEFWMISSLVCFVLFAGLFIFIIYLGKKTHAILEFKALITGKPIAYFLTDHKRVDAKVIEPEGGIIMDKKYGAYVINSSAAYIDAKTRNIMMFFNSNLGVNGDIESYKTASVLVDKIKSDKDLEFYKYAIANGYLNEKGELCVEKDNERYVLAGLKEITKENIDFGKLKAFTNAVLPHNIRAKIEMVIASRLANFGKPNYMNLVLIFGGVLLAMVAGWWLITTFGSGSTTTIVQQVGQAAANSSGVAGSFGG